MNQSVPSSILSQDTCLGCGPGLQLGVLERQPHINVSLPLFLPPSPSLKINNKTFKKEFISHSHHSLKQTGPPFSILQLCSPEYVASDVIQAR